MPKKEEAFHIELEGSGPYEMPMIVKTTGAKTGWKEFFVLKLETDAGQMIYLPISNRAAQSLWNVLGPVLQKTGKSDETRH